MWYRYLRIKLGIFVIVLFVQNALCMHFVGRDVELKKLQYDVLKGNFVTITGPSGIGKTALVRKFSIINQNKYDFIWWFYEEDNFEENLINLGYYLDQKYNLKIVNEYYPKEVNLANVQAYLMTTKQKALFIFDNFSNLTHIHKVPNRNNFIFIVTSLNRFYFGRTMKLDKLSRHDAIELVQSNVLCSLHEANLLAQTLQDHPLALTQSIAYILHTGIKIEQYLDLYNKFLEKVWRAEETLRNIGVIDKTVYSTISIVLDRLKAENISAYKLLDYFTVYNKHVPEAVLKEVYLNYVSRDEVEFLNALASLRKYSLIEEGRTQKGRHFSCHDSVFKVLKFRMGQKEAENLLLDIMISCKNLLPSLVNESINSFLSRDTELRVYIESISEEAIKSKIVHSSLEHLLCSSLEYAIFGSKDYKNAASIILKLDQYYQKQQNIDLNLPYYHSLKATYYAWIDVDYEKSNSEYKRALEMMHDYPGQALYKIFSQLLLAQNYCYTGHLDEAEKLIRRG